MSTTIYSKSNKLKKVFKTQEHQEEIINKEPFNMNVILKGGINLKIVLPEGTYEGESQSQWGGFTADVMFEIAGKAIEAVMATGIVSSGSVHNGSYEIDY